MYRGCTIWKRPGAQAGFGGDTAIWWAEGFMRHPSTEACVHADLLAPPFSLGRLERATGCMARMLHCRASSERECNRHPVARKQ